MVFIDQDAYYYHEHPVHFGAAYGEGFWDTLKSWASKIFGNKSVQSALKTGAHFLLQNAAPKLIDMGLKELAPKLPPGMGDKVKDMANKGLEELTGRIKSDKNEPTHKNAASHGALERPGRAPVTSTQARQRIQDGEMEAIGFGVRRVAAKPKAGVGGGVSKTKVDELLNRLLKR